MHASDFPQKQHGMMSLANHEALLFTNAPCTLALGRSLVNAEFLNMMDMVMGVRIPDLGFKVLKMIAFLAFWVARRALTCRILALEKLYNRANIAIAVVSRSIPLELRV